MAPTICADKDTGCTFRESRKHTSSVINYVGRISHKTTTNQHHHPAHSVLKTIRKSSQKHGHSKSKSKNTTMDIDVNISVSNNETTTQASKQNSSNKINKSISNIQLKTKCLNINNGNKCNTNNSDNSTNHKFNNYSNYNNNNNNNNNISDSYSVLSSPTLSPLSSPSSVSVISTASPASSPSLPVRSPVSYSDFDANNSCQSYQDDDISLYEVNFNNNNNNNNNDNNNNKREGRHTTRLLEIAMKTVKLIKRNQYLQAKLIQLQEETDQFVESVLSNPENKNLRDRIDNNINVKL